MSKFSGLFSVLVLSGAAIFGAVVPTFAQRTQRTPPRATTRNESDTRYILRSLNSQTDDFRYSLDNEFARNALSADEENEINDDVRDFEDSLKQFGEKLDQRRENADDVRKILAAAQSINDFLNAKRFGAAAQKNWTETRNLLDRLAANYQLAGNWNGGSQTNYPNGAANRNYPNYPNNNPANGNYPATANSSYGNALDGDYQLDRTRSEDAQTIADRAIRGGNSANNQTAQRDLAGKLAAPERVSINIRGSQVTLDSSNAAPLTFAADGRDRTETAADGATIRVRATLRGQELTVSSIGGETDYTIIFTPIDNGAAMRVTRRITTDYLPETVFAESVYTKTGASARTINNPINNPVNDDNGDYSSNDSPNNRRGTGNYPNNLPPTGNTRTGQFIVPNGTLVAGILDQDVDTKVSRNNDKFSMTVQSPNEYRGAVVEGYISGVNRSGKVSGRSQITFNFERITLSNGRVYDFNGYLQSVTDDDGKTVKVDTEGTAQGGNQTNETVKRGGIGAGIGAVIGAIAGGGKGAAIGAILGGGAGAGSVVVQGKDDLELRAGSTLTVQTSSPVR